VPRKTDCFASGAETGHHQSSRNPGLDPNVEMKDSGIDWLGKIPEGWNISPLKRALAAPMVDGPHETPEFVAEGIPFVSADASHDGRIHLSECRGYISSDIHRKYCQKVKPRRNDIFIVKSGSTTGKTVLVDFDDEFSIWSPLALVRCRHNVNYKFVFYALSSSYFQKEVQDNWSYGTQPNIGMGVLKSLLIALPTPKNQAIIADFLDDISASIDKTREKCQSEIFFCTNIKTALFLLS
jgi:type I restriction enzyme S subunit